MREIIDKGKTANLFEERLTDGSKVYDVGVGRTLIHCSDRDAALELFVLLEDEAKVVGAS